MGFTLRCFPLGKNNGAGPVNSKTNGFARRELTEFQLRAARSWHIAPSHSVGLLLGTLAGKAVLFRFCDEALGVLNRFLAALDEFTEGQFFFWTFALHKENSGRK